MSEKLVVIGGTAAGLSAASKAKRIKPEMEITVFERTGYISYGSCGLPYFVGGLIEEPEDLVSVSLESMNQKRGVPTFIHHEVTKIDRANKRVHAVNLDTGASVTAPYDKLVIATGASPIQPNIPGADASNLFCLRTVEDGVRLKGAIADTGKRAAIIGGGFIGLELAEELTNAGVTVDVFELLPRLCPFLPAAYSDIVRNELVKNGVHVHLGTGVEEILTRGGAAVAVVGSDGRAVPTDLVLCSIGVRPNTALAATAGLALGLKNGVVVDDGMRTSDPDIFACGDCVQMKNRITGAPAYVPLGTTANKQGRVAGENAAGGSAIFPGILGSMVTKVFDCTIACTGLSKAQAEQAGFACFETAVTKLDRASYYPGGTNTELTLIAEKGTGRLLGAQAIGSETVAGRINVCAAAITAGMTVMELNELDLVYAPPVAPVYDPILIAAAQAVKSV